MAANEENSKKNAPDTDPTIDETGEQPEYPNPTGPQAADNPLDQLIHEWDREHPQTLGGAEGQAVEAPASGELNEPLHNDEYKRLSPEEFDEVDALLSEEPPGSPVGQMEADPPQMRLLAEDVAGEIDGIFEEEPASTATGDSSLPPVDILEEEPVEATPEPTPQPPPPEENIEEPPPHFEDRGMGGGFFVSEEELQPTDSPEFDVEVPAPDAAPENGPPEEGGLFGADLFFPPGPTMEIHPPPDIVGGLPADSKLVDSAVTQDRINRLMYRAEMARKRINDEIDSIELARELLELIRSATTLILSDKANYEEAERSLNEVEFRLSYSRRVKVWSDAISYRLLAYEVFWLLTLGLGALFVPSLLSAMIAELNTFSPNSLPDFIHMDDLFLGVSTALWGGLGGVVGAMYSLWRHVSLKQDFNPQHKMWYYTQPIMGIPIGVVIFLLVRIGIGYTVEGTLDFASPYGIYMLAWIAGFQQNILYEIIRQILKLFRIQN